MRYVQSYKVHIGDLKNQAYQIVLDFKYKIISQGD